MPIELLEDVIEDLASQAGIFGACRHAYDPEGDECDGNCRPCWTARLRTRIIGAVDVERRLNAPEVSR